jgi:hypothetical protein
VKSSPCRTRTKHPCRTRTKHPQAHLAQTAVRCRKLWTAEVLTRLVSEVVWKDRGAGWPHLAKPAAFALRCRRTPNEGPPRLVDAPLCVCSHSMAPCSASSGPRSSRPYTRTGTQALRNHPHALTCICRTSRPCICTARNASPTSRQRRSFGSLQSCRHRRGPSHCTHHQRRAWTLPTTRGTSCNLGTEKRATQCVSSVHAMLVTDDLWLVKHTLHQPQ